MHIQNFNFVRIYALATLLLSSIVFSDEPLVIDVRSLEEVKTGIIQEENNQDGDNLETKADNDNLENKNDEDNLKN